MSFTFIHILVGSCNHGDLQFTQVALFVMVSKTQSPRFPQGLGLQGLKHIDFTGEELDCVVMNPASRHSHCCLLLLYCPCGLHGSLIHCLLYLHKLVLSSGRSSGHLISVLDVG